MGYSAALLTGLEYAMNKTYDNTVWFDGDGQHIASEVKKLFARREETNSDIVIGSRFLNKTDYNHGFFKEYRYKFVFTINKNIHWCKDI